MNNSIKYMKMIMFPMAVLLITACFPERTVTDPDYEVKETRRPAKVHNVPLSDQVNVSLTTDITIWFDELMDEASVQDNFYMWPKVALDSTQSMIFSNSEQDVIYASVSSSGVFKSIDNGESWSWISVDTFRESILELVISPYNPSVLFAITDNGVYKSEDAGLTWNQSGSGITDLSILSIAADPNHENRFFVTTSSDGVFKTEDSGVTWVAINEGIRTGRPIFDVVVDPSNSNYLYAGTEGNYIMTSVDGGANWVRMRNGLSSRDFSVLAVHPQTSNLVFAGSVDAGVFLSRDLGENWTDISSNLPNKSINTLVVDPGDTNTVYAGTNEGLFVTNNLGISWSAVNEDWNEILIKTVSLNPTTSSILFVAIEGDGVYRSDNNGEDWTKSSSINLNELYVQGDFMFSNWQDSTTIITPLDSVTSDTTVIFPYVYERALEGWDGTGDPPVPTNPEATKLTFTLHESLLPDWDYLVRIKGTFESDKETLRGEKGAHDLAGNSFETNSTFSFKTEDN